MTEPDVVDDALRQGSVAQFDRIVVGGHHDVLVALPHGDDHVGALHRAGRAVAALEGLNLGREAQGGQKPDQDLGPLGVGGLDELGGAGGDVGPVPGLGRGFLGEGGDSGQQGRGGDERTEQHWRTFLGGAIRNR